MKLMDWMTVEGYGRSSVRTSFTNIKKLAEQVNAARRELPPAWFVIDVAQMEKDFEEVADNRIRFKNRFHHLFQYLAYYEK